MELEAFLSISLHYVAETVPAEWADGGARLCRVPTRAGEGLKDTAQDRVRHATGSELRFVPSGDDAEIEITLSTQAEAEIRTLWGPFHSSEPTTLGSEPQTFTFSVPDRVAEIADGVGTDRFDARVCRILFESVPAVAVHDVSGGLSPARTRGTARDTRALLRHLHHGGRRLLGAPPELRLPDGP